MHSSLLFERLPKLASSILNYAGWPLARPSYAAARMCALVRFSTVPVGVRRSYTHVAVWDHARDASAVRRQSFCLDGERIQSVPRSFPALVSSLAPLPNGTADAEESLAVAATSSTNPKESA